MRMRGLRFKRFKVARKGDSNELSVKGEKELNIERKRRNKATWNYRREGGIGERGRDLPDIR